MFGIRGSIWLFFVVAVVTAGTAFWSTVYQAVTPEPQVTSIEVTRQTFEAPAPKEVSSDTKPELEPEVASRLERLGFSASEFHSLVVE